MTKEEVAEDTRDIYLLLNKNYTKYLADINGTAEKTFPKEVLDIYLSDLEELKLIRKAGVSKKSLGFTSSFNFTRDNREVDQIRYGQQRMIRAVSAEISKKPGCAIVSLGIGNGNTASEYVKGHAGKIIGIDLHDNYLSEAKKLIPDLEALRADLNLPVPLPDASADIIECTMVAHHIKDIENLFSEAARILNNGGLFLFADLTDKTQPEEKMTYREVHRHPAFHGVEFFRTHEEIKALLRKYFKMTDYERIGPGILYFTARK